MLMRLHFGLILSAFIVPFMAVGNSYAAKLVPVQFDGNFTCDSKKNHWSNKFFGRIEGGSVQIRYDRDVTYNNNNRNITVLKIENDGTATLRWDWHSMLENYKIHLFEDKRIIKTGDKQLIFSANVTFMGQPSEENCQAIVNFEESPFIHENDNTLIVTNSTAGDIENANDEAKKQIELLKQQIAEQQTKGSRFVTTDQVIVSARSKLDVLTRSANSYQNIQVAMRADYEVRMKTQIQQLRSRISLLTVAKVSASNSEEIKQLEGQLEILSSRTFENEKAYQELQSRSDELAQQIVETKNTLSAELARTKQDLDDQRKNDLASVGNQFADLGATVQANKQKAAKDVADLKAITQSEIGQLKSDLGALDARVADLEKGQQNLATKQVELFQQQSNTDKRVTATNQLLANILLPVSERPDDWMMRVAAVPVQQQQFCRIVDRFYDDLAAVYKVRNDIKKNALYKDRHQDLAALLPGGAINSWVVRVVEVTQAKDGSAAIMLQPPCRAMLGSDACAPDQKKFRATVTSGSLMYRELARINAGDFVTISGKILYAEDEGDDKPLPEYALYQPGKHCTEADGAKTQDVFVTELNNLAVLK